MNLVDMKITEFCDVLASDAPAPGGGSTSALMGSLGAALAQMVAGLTVGRKKYLEHQKLMEAMLDASQKLRIQLLKIIDEDTKAFNLVGDALAMPKEADEEKSARAAAMQEALKACTLTPIAMMRHSVAALLVIEKALGCYNTNAASDLGVAALALKSCAHGAWLNVLINLGGIKDEAFAKAHREEGEALLEQATALGDKIYGEVLSLIQ